MENFMIEYGADLQVAVFFVALACLAGLEQFIPRRSMQAGKAHRLRTNVILTMVAIASLSLMPVTFIAAAWWAQEQGIGLLNSQALELPLTVMVMLNLLLRGFISFFTHWLNHRVPWLWRLHRVHHLDTHLDVSSTVRFHPLEMPVTTLTGLPLVVALGLSPWVLLIYEIFDTAITVFSHSNIRLPTWLNRPLRYLVVTPDLHAVHHSTHLPETNSNYSAVFPIWDILLGTFRTETREPLDTMPMGLHEVRDPRANQFWWLLASPFRPGGLTQTRQSDQPPASAFDSEVAPR